MIAHLLNRTLDTYRPTTAPDGSGGYHTSLVLVGPVASMVCQPSAAERREADQWGAAHTHTVYVELLADVLRGDELRGEGQRFRVLATVQPSRATYTKALVQLVQPEGT